MTKSPTPESQQAALKPCPFCSHNDAIVRSNMHEAVWVLCRSCGASSSRYRSKERATEAWNQRAPVDVSNAALAGLPDDLFSHGDAWRSAIEEMRDNAPSRTEDGNDDRSYWQHELNVFDRTWDALRAHPAGGVNEDVVERVAEWLSYRYGSDLPLKEKAPEVQIRWRADARNALSAAGIGAVVVEARPLEEWYEDMGDVLWWKFPVTEAPYVGSPICLGQTVEIAVKAYGVEEIMRVNVGGWPGYHTHFTPIPLAAAPSHEKGQ